MLAAARLTGMLTGASIAATFLRLSPTEAETLALVTGAIFAAAAAAISMARLKDGGPVVVLRESPMNACEGLELKSDKTNFLHALSIVPMKGADSRPINRLQVQIADAESCRTVPLDEASASR